MSSLKEICEGLVTDPLPPRRERDELVAHAPVRTPDLTADEQRVSGYIHLPFYPYIIQKRFIRAMKLLHWSKSPFLFLRKRSIFVQRQHKERTTS